MNLRVRTAGLSQSIMSLLIISKTIILSQKLIYKDDAYGFIFLYTKESIHIVY